MTLIQLGRRPARPAAPATDASARARSRYAIPDACIRPARVADMAQVEPIIAGFARQGVMLPKSRAQLFRTFREFVVAVDAAGRVLGCAALRVYTPEQAEISALAVAPDAHGHGLGRRLVEALLADAARLGVRTVFALTLEEAFFHRLGFRTAPRDDFPLKIQADCLGCPRQRHCPEITVARDIEPHITGPEQNHA